MRISHGRTDVYSPDLMIWSYASRYPYQVIVAAVALGSAALATLAIPWQFKAMIDSGFVAGGGDVAPHFRLFSVIVLALALATALRFYFVSWLGVRTVADIRQAVQRNLLRLAPGIFEVNSPSEIPSRSEERRVRKESVCTCRARW